MRLLPGKVNPCSMNALSTMIANQRKEVCISFKLLNQTDLILMCCRLHGVDQMVRKCHQQHRSLMERNAGHLQLEGDLNQSDPRHHLFIMMWHVELIVAVNSFSTCYVQCLLYLICILDDAWCLRKFIFLLSTAFPDIDGCN